MLTGYIIKITVLVFLCTLRIFELINYMFKQRTAKGSFKAVRGIFHLFSLFLLKVHIFQQT